VRPETRRGANVLQYRAASGPKAAATHPAGVFVVVSDAASQRAAEDLALARCNNDPTSKTTGGPCFLYAAGDQVVLPKRLVVSSVLHETLLARMAAASVAADERERIARSYETDPDHKAIAVSFEKKHTFRTARWSAPVAAEVSALEGCQILFGNPCVLVAVDDRVEPAGDGAPKPRDMPRVHSADTFDPEQIPRVTLATQR
jgi:hypothetical protein